MFNFKFIGTVNVEKAAYNINQISPTKWVEFSFRQQVYKTHKDTETIPLIFDTEFSYKSLIHRDFFNYVDEYNNLTEIFTEAHGPGYILRMLLVKLKPRSIIPRHADGGETLAACHRHHIAVITNKNVIFTINDEDKFLQMGDIWEINNQAPHSVVNSSTEARVHFIVDWIRVNK